MYAWGLSLSTSNYHNIVNQLCFDTKYKVKIHKWDRENLCWWNWSRICLEHHQSETSECNLLFLLIWGKWPTKGAEETDAQFWGPEMFPCIVAKLRASWKQKPLWKLRRCNVASHLLPWGFPCILSHLTIFNRPVFNEAIKALFIILGWKMAIEDHQFTAQALCLLLIFF